MIYTMLSEGVRRFKALVVNDYPDKPYAEWIKTGRKSIETRTGRLFSFRGDVVICCGKTNSVGPNRGNALCIVELWKGRDMLNNQAEIDAACIEWDPDRKSLLLRNWRHFSRDFKFTTCAVQFNFQGMFELILPKDVQIIQRPDITPFNEPPIYELF